MKHAPNGQMSLAGQLCLVWLNTSVPCSTCHQTQSNYTCHIDVAPLATRSPVSTPASLIWSPRHDSPNDATNRLYCHISCHTRDIATKMHLPLDRTVLAALGAPIALPVPVIVSNFSRIYHQNQRADKRKAQKVNISKEFST